MNENVRNYYFYGSVNDRNWEFAITIFIKSKIHAKNSYKKIKI